MSGNKSDYNSATAHSFQRNDITRASLGGNNYLQQQSSANYYNALPDQMEGMNLGNYNYQNRSIMMTADYQRSRSPGRELDTGYQHHPSQRIMHYDNYYAPQQKQQQIYGYSDFEGGQNYGMLSTSANYGGYSVSGYGEEGGYGYTQGYSPSQYQRSSSGSLPRGTSFVGARKESTSFEHSEPLPGNLTKWPRSERHGVGNGIATEFVEMTVTLLRQDTGFGFRIVGGTEEGSQVKKEKPT